MNTIISKIFQLVVIGNLDLEENVDTVGKYENLPWL